MAEESRTLSKGNTMHRSLQLPFLSVLASILVALPVALCQEKKEKHDHPSKGPHGGALVELGNEEYHAEMVHDEKAGKVTVFLLDSAGKQAVPISARDLTVNIRRSGKPAQYRLKAAPLEGEEQGKCSAFASSDKELLEHLDAEGVEARLRVSINGKSYSGKLEHSHEHDKDGKGKKATEG